VKGEVFKKLKEGAQKATKDPRVKEAAKQIGTILLATLAEILREIVANKVKKEKGHAK